MDERMERIAVALECLLALMTDHFRDMALGNTPKQPAAPANTATDDLLSMPGSTQEPAAEKKTRKPRAAAAEKEPAAETAEPAVSAAPVTLAQLAESVRKLVASDAAAGRTKAQSILEKFGAKRISEVKEADFPKVIARVNELLKAK